MNDLPKYVADYGPLLVIGTTVLLGLGCAAIRCSSSPIHRQRLGELTLGAVLVWMLLATLPLPRLMPYSAWRFNHSTLTNDESVMATTRGFASTEETFELLHDRDGSVIDPATTQPSVVISRTENSGESIIEPVEPSDDVPSSAMSVPAAETVKHDCMTPFILFQWNSATFVAVLYGVGTFVCATWLAIGHLLLLWVRCRGQVAEPWLHELFQSLSNDAGVSRVRLLVSSRCSRAISWGAIWPVIVLPAAMCQQKNEAQLRMILLHELGHTAQGDAWGNLLLTLAFPLLYVQPLYWWLRSQVRLAAELVADDYAARQLGKEMYALELIALARQASRVGALWGVTGVVSSPSQFYRRMQMLLVRETPLALRPSRTWRWMSLCGTGLAIALATALFGTQPVDGQQSAAEIPTEVIDSAAPQAAKIGFSDDPKVTPDKPATEDLIRTAVPEEASSIPPAITIAEEPTNPPPPADPFLAQLDEAIEITSHRYLQANRHSPWQIFQGLMALKRDMDLKLGQNTVNAIDWIATSDPQFEGQPLLIKTPHGGKFHPFTRPYAFEGHPGLFLALLSQSDLPLDFQFKAGTEVITIGDIVNNLMKEVNTKGEVTWVLWGLQHYLPTNVQWVNLANEPWSIERLVHIETTSTIIGAPSGGNPRLYALTLTRDKHLKSGGALQGIWQQADERIRRHIELAHSLQNQDGTFSSKFYQATGHSNDRNERFSTTGGTMAFLSIALPDERLNEPWVRKAVNVLSAELIANRQSEISCGPLYDTLNALITYRDRYRTKVLNSADDDPKSQVRQMTRSDSTYQKRLLKNPNGSYWMDTYELAKGATSFKRIDRVLVPKLPQEAEAVPLGQTKVPAAAQTPIAGIQFQTSTAGIQFHSTATTSLDAPADIKGVRIPQKPELNNADAQQAAPAAGSSGITKQIDLVALATSYADAISAAEVVADDPVAFERAQRKINLLRQIAMIELEVVGETCKRMEQLHASGVVTARELIELKSRRAMLVEILRTQLRMPTPKAADPKPKNRNGDLPDSNPT